MADGKLSDRKVRALSELGRYSDGATLYLVVAPGGSKQWVQRLTVRRRQTDVGLGGYPVVGLREAREKAQANRAQARSGADPLLERRRAAVPTFRDLASQHIEALRPSWRNAKHAAQWGSTLAAYAHPFIGNRPVDQVTRADVIGLLSPIWTKKPEMARRVRQRVRAVMARANALEYIEHNPAGEGIDAALAKLPRIRAHHPALPYAQLPAALRAVRESIATPAVTLGFEFLALTACRSGEVRGARWEEIDIACAAWTVPAERMKGGRTHRVPLPEQATVGCRCGVKGASSLPRRRRPVRYSSETATGVPHLFLSHPPVPTAWANAGPRLSNNWTQGSRTRGTQGTSPAARPPPASPKPPPRASRRSLRGRDGRRFRKPGARGCRFERSSGSWESTGPPSGNTWTPRVLPRGDPGRVLRRLHLIPWQHNRVTFLPAT